MTGYRLTKAAAADLQGIRDYIARDSRVAALRVVRKLRQSMAGLAAMPGKGHRRTDLTAKPVLFWGVYSYLVVYRPNTKPLEILRVIHGARDAAELLPSRPERGRPTS